MNETTKTSRSRVDIVSALDVLTDTLPGDPVPYAMAAGEGARHIVGDALVTVIARSVDTGGLFTAAWVSGPANSTVPAHAVEDETFIYVTDGRVAFTTGTFTKVLIGGDALRVTANGALSWVMQAHSNRFLIYSSGSARTDFLTGAGAASERRFHSSNRRALPDEIWAGSAVRSGTKLICDEDTNPDASSVVPAADGDHRASWGEINSYLARGKDTHGQYFAVHTRGTRSDWIPRHRHHLHTENFVCIDGRIRLDVNGRDMLLTRGDFVHAPAGTIHSFRFESIDTQMLGLLTTDVFEPFFEFMYEPTLERVPNTEGNRNFPAAGFARARAELDVEVMGPPPSR